MNWAYEYCGKKSKIKKGSNQKIDADFGRSYLHICINRYHPNI